MVNAGRILIIPKGQWSNLVSYDMLDLVTEGSIAYIARQASVGVNPSTDTSMTYWQTFGSAAEIATTTAPGIVMPDGTTITVDASGLIAANIGIDDITDVDIATLTNNQVLRYNSTSQEWENVDLSADNVSYDNTNSGLAATDSQAAIDELASSKEAAPTILTATLAIGSTTITFNNAAIKTTSLLDVYADVYGIVPTDIQAINGQAVLTFDAQTVAVSVKLVVR